MATLLTRTDGRYKTALRLRAGELNVNATITDTTANTEYVYVVGAIHMPVTVLLAAAESAIVEHAKIKNITNNKWYATNTNGA